MNKKLIQAFRVIIAITFIFSALSKITSVTFFDGVVAELLIGDNYYEEPGKLYFIQILTRLLIALELFLGVAVLQNQSLKKVILPALFLMLVAFQFQMVIEGILLMNEGKTFVQAFLEGNCGCFGDILPMNPVESLSKNFIALFMIGYVYAKVNDRNLRILKFKTYTLPLLLAFITFFTLLAGIKKYTTPSKPIKTFNYIEEEESKPVIDSIVQDTSKILLDTVETSKTTTKPKELPQTKSSIESNKKAVVINAHKKEVKEVTSKEVTTKPEQTVPTKVETYNDILAKYTQFSDGVTVNLNKGNKLICMFSLSCGHCQETYKAIVEMSESGKLPNTLLFLYGTDFELNYFFNQAGGKHPYIKLDDYNEFKKLLDGHDFPYVLATENGQIKDSWDLEDKEINSLIQKYYGIEKTEPKDNGIFGEEEEDSALGIY